MLISGEAGVGKSILIEEFARNLQTRWLWAACDGLFYTRRAGAAARYCQPTSMVNCLGFAALRQNGISSMAHCSGSSATYQLSPLWQSRTFIGLMRQRWIS